LFCLHELKILVPQQVALAAFGDLGISHQIWPGISAVRYPVEKIVERSIQMLIDLVEGRQIESKQVIFPTSIMMRGST